MARLRPFAAVRYARRPNLHFSNVIAPPYDVLDERGKAAFQAKDPHNIVSVDLPHLPPKTVGPDETYEKANIHLQSWLDAGVLIQDTRPALYPYMQSFDQHRRTIHPPRVFAL